jgi:hypothetical protein
MAELEIAGTTALGGCIGDEEQSRKPFKKGSWQGISDWEAEGVFVWYVDGLSGYENGGEAFVSTLCYAVACSLEGSAAWYPVMCE